MESITELELMAKCYRDAFSIVQSNKVGQDDTVKVAAAIIAVKLFEVRYLQESVEQSIELMDIIMEKICNSEKPVEETNTTESETVNLEEKSLSFR